MIFKISGFMITLFMVCIGPRVIALGYILDVTKLFIYSVTGCCNFSEYAAPVVKPTKMWAL
jgi:hypothetical protein